MKKYFFSGLYFRRWERTERVVSYQAGVRVHLQWMGRKLVKSLGMDWSYRHILSSR